MSATDELRRLLDEREVEWWNDTDPEPQRQTNVWAGGQLVTFHENANGTVGYVVYSTHDLTPEQAIAATLGNDGLERSNDGVDTTCVPDDYTAKLMAEVSRLQAKSNGLLKELEAEHALAEMLGLWLDDAKAENAKLRELVNGMRYCAHESYGMCARVPVGGERPFTCCPLYDFDAKEYLCEKLMQELGIEVDE